MSILAAVDAISEYGGDVVRFDREVRQQVIVDEREGPK
jgi:hypothetical protein